MKCPRCGFEQPDDIYCAQCGVEALKWDITHKSAVRRWRLIATLTAALFAVGLASWLFYSTDKPGDSIELISNTLEAPGDRFPATGRKPSSTVEPPRPEPSSTPEAEPISSEEKPVAPPPVVGAKPVPSERLPKTMEKDVLVSVSPGEDAGLVGKPAKDLRLFAAHDRQMAPIPFQVDAGWTPPEKAIISGGARLLVMSSDLGDLDDNAYPPRSYGTMSRVNVNDGRKRAWAYLFQFDYPAAPPARAYLRYNRQSQSLDAKSYRIERSPEHPAALNRLSLNGSGNILDRQKLRLIIGDEAWTEEDIEGKMSKTLAGPLLVRTLWNGTLQLTELIPLVVENEYTPDGWKTTYILDMTSVERKNAKFRVYFDLSRAEGVAGTRIVTPDDLLGKEPDGRSGKAVTPKENWFIIAGDNYALKVSADADTDVALYYVDDGELFDPPEYESGCYGCIGFELAAEGATELVINYEVMDEYKPGDPPPAAAHPAGKLVILENE